MNTLKTAITKRRPINLFFTELIIALLFFSISGAVILKVFASADNKSQQSLKKENAIICAQSIAEVYSETASVEETFKVVFSHNGDFDESGIFGITLDDYCSPSDDGNISMIASEQREKTVSGSMSHLTVTFACGDTELYSLVCTAYCPNGGEVGA